MGIEGQDGNNESLEDRELRLAQEAAAAEANPAQNAEPAKPANPEPPKPEVAAAKPAEPTEGAPDKPATVPVAVARAERQARQKAEQDAAYWRGRAEAAHELAEEVQKPSDERPTLTPQQRLEQIRQERIAIADDYDAGNIKTRDWEEKRLALEDEERQLREQMSPPRNASPAPQSDLGLEERTQQLERDYPILTKVTAEELQPLVPIARQQAAREGRPIQAGAAGTLELRTRVAKLANTFYGTGQQPPALPEPPKAHPAESALAAAQAHPVDIGQMGAAATAGQMSEAELESKLGSMGEAEQLEFLATQPALVQRVMQRASR